MAGTLPAGAGGARELPPLGLERTGHDARFRLLHEAFLLTLAPPPNALVAAGRSRIRFELYQQIPAAPDALAPQATDPQRQRRRPGQDGRDRDRPPRADRPPPRSPHPDRLPLRHRRTVARGDGRQVRPGLQGLRPRGGPRGQEVDRPRGQPLGDRARIIASFDYLKCREGAFREVQNVRFNVIVCDEVHHLADHTSGDDVSDRHRLAQWISRRQRCPHAALGNAPLGLRRELRLAADLFEPTLVPDPKDDGVQARRTLPDPAPQAPHQEARRLPLVRPRRPLEPDPGDPDPAEAAVHSAVAKQAEALDEQAESSRPSTDRYACLWRRSSASGPPSSLAALRGDRRQPAGKPGAARRRMSNSGATTSARSARARRSPTRTSEQLDATPTAATSPASAPWARSSAPSRRRWRICSTSRASWPMPDRHRVEGRSPAGRAAGDPRATARREGHRLQRVRRDGLWLAGFLGRQATPIASRPSTASSRAPSASRLAGSSRTGVAPAQHRCRQRGTQPPGALPAGDPLRAAVQPQPHAPATGACRPIGQERPCCSLCQGHLRGRGPLPAVHQDRGPSRAPGRRWRGAGSTAGRPDRAVAARVARRSPAAIAAAERSIDEELSRNDPHTRAVLGDDPLTSGEVERLQAALARWAGPWMSRIADFVVRATWPGQAPNGSGRSPRRVSAGILGSAAGVLAV